jgi:hypothetical protein
LVGVAVTASWDFRGTRIKPARREQEAKVAKLKKEVKWNVISMRVSDQEKKVLEEITRRSRGTISDLMREAVQCYTEMLESRMHHS